MRILHAVHGFFPEFVGGTERYVEALALAQKRLGHDVRLLSGSGETGEAPWIDLIDHDGLPLYRLHRIGIDIDLWTKSDAPHAEGPLAKLLARLCPDVFHVHHWLRFSRTLVRLAAGQGVPVVLTLHDLSSSCPRGFRIHARGHFCEIPMSAELCLGCAPTGPGQDPGEVRLELDRFRAAMRAEIEAATRILVPSRAHGALLARLHEIEEARLAVLPLGDITSVRPPTGPRRLDPDGRLRLVHWGHFRHDKGVHVPLEALALLTPEERERVHLTLYGEHVFEDYQTVLEEKAAGLPVAFAGAFRPENLDGSRYDLAIIPTLCHESHSFVLDEAFRLGIPLLVSDRGALVERAGGAAIAFPPGDAAALAACIRDVLTDPARLQTLSAAIPDRLRSMESHAGQVLDVYRSAIDDGVPDGVEAPAVTRERLGRARAVESRDIRIAELGREVKEQG